MRDGLAYVLASLALGWVAVWGSELMFWITPPPDTGLPGIVMAWGLYALAAAACLSALVWSGLGGWRAAFLGGALLGFFVEGAAVSTMYDAFPLQLVWTPLAWHALLTGLVIVGGGIAAIRGPVWRQGLGLVCLGLFGGAWGLYWPTERAVLAGLPLMLLYLAVTGALAALALAGLSRLPVPRRAWWLGLAPLAILMLWGAGALAAPSPVRLAGPLMAAATLWAMGRLAPGGPVLAFGPPLPWGRSLLSVLAPVLTAALCVTGWQALGARPTNIPIALGTGAIGLALWLWLLVLSWRRPAAATGHMP